MPQAPTPFNGMIGTLARNPHLAGLVQGPRNPWSGLTSFGQQLQARGAPRPVGGQGALPAGMDLGALSGMLSSGGGGMSGMGMFPMGLLGMFAGGGQGQGGFGGLLDFLPAEMRAKMPEAWQAGTQTIPAGTPQHWLFDLFNRNRG